MKFIVAVAFVLSLSASLEANWTAEGLIKQIEGFRHGVYTDQSGRQAIGYGFVSADMVRKGWITEGEASAELRRICRRISVKLREELSGGKPLTAQEEAALVSFIYNVGWSNFRTSAMLRKLKAGRRGLSVADEFSRWVYVTRDGRKMKSLGLSVRRDIERGLFLGVRKK